MLTKILLTLFISNFSLPQGQGAVYGAPHFETPGFTKINTYAVEPILDSPSALALDGETGRVLFNKNGNESRQIASITKLITSYIYLTESGNNLAREITVEETDARSGGQSHIYRGEIATARDFLHLALVSSDNSVAISLARAGGFLDSYARKTQKLATQLELKNTRLVEPSGLASGNISTAFEIALLAREIFKNEFLQTTTMKEGYSFYLLNGNKTKERRITTTNDLLTTDLFTITAGKTGHTDAAGYCLVFQAQNKSGKNIIIAILGAETSEDRFQDAKSLAYWIFENFE